MDNYQLDSNLTFCEGTLPALTAHVANLALSNQDSTLKECRLTLKISPTSYQQIDTHALFNLSPEFRGPLSNDDFLPDSDIQLEITLKPDLLPQLAEQATTPEAIGAYLTSLSQQPALLQTADPDTTAPPFNLLLNPKNWFCLSVKQLQGSGETGYTTFWNYVNPAILNHPETASEQIAEGITHFAENWAAVNLTAATESITEELLTGVNTLFDGFETWLDHAFSKDDMGKTAASDRDQSILATVIDFFTKDDWTFTKLQGQSVLQMAYRGENGLWNCYAQSRETEEQFAFYSIYPELISEDKRLAMAELLTRLNYGLVIGNFEMDFNDGEVRYKTSLGVEGNVLTSQVIRRLVYANVTIMDHYLPSIQAVMEGKESPEGAIAQIEAPNHNCL